MRRRLGAAALVALLLVVAAAAWVHAVDSGSAEPLAAAPNRALPPPDAAIVARGAYLVRAANCAGCHSARGGAPWAGGRPFETPFGIVHSTNLTPDRATGLGDWTADAFWRALHHGRSRDGRRLYPVFPYPNYTRIARADADAMHAYLATLAPVAQANRPPALAFPFDTQAALAVWRALYFRPAMHVDDPARSAAWNRGAYLVEGLGHCNACHSARNALGATASPLDLQGGLIPLQNWYAPSLAAPAEAGVQAWPEADVVRLLKTGVAERGVVNGPMAEVVLGSTQHLDEADLAAMAAYLRALPERRAAAHPPATAEPSPRGARLYADHCADCHGERGEGVAGAYPALAGNRAVTMASIANLVHIVREGGFAPATTGHPRPYGMPPFAVVLADAEIADVLTFMRGSWGHRSSAVSALDVAQARAPGWTW